VTAPRYGFGRVVILMSKLPKRPRDLNQAAKLVVDIASGEVDDKKASRSPRKRKVRAVKPATKAEGRRDAT
jgi:hypothetical protein